MNRPNVRGSSRLRSLLHPKSRGQSLVEFALVLPLMLILMAAAIDLGRLFYAYVAVENAAKEGAFFGARNPLCADNSNVSCPDPLNVQWHIEYEASNLKNALGTSALTSQINCLDTAGTVVAPINNCQNGDTYKVDVSYDFRLITPILSSIVGNGLTLSASSRATVIGDAFDPAGLEPLVWISSTNASNASAIQSVCTEADHANYPGFYFGPCQDLNNSDNYLQFPEASTVTVHTRIRNTGNIDIAGLTYEFKVNGATITKPAACSTPTLPTSLAKGSAAASCSFTLPATVPNGSTGVSRTTVEFLAQGTIQSVGTGITSGAGTFEVASRPKFTVDLKASPYRLGPPGNGVGGVATYPNGLAVLQRQAASTDPTLASPNGWLYLTVTNSGGAAPNFSVGVTRNGTALNLAALCPFIPPALSAGGQSGNSYSCFIPQTFSTTSTFTFAATATATNSTTFAGQQTVQVRTQDCAAPNLVVPNLVDTLLPTPDGTNKTLGQAQAEWSAAGFTGLLSAVPNLSSNSVSTQSVAAYTCVSAGTPMSLTTQP